MKGLISIDFASRPALPRAGTLALAAAALVLGWQGWSSWQEQQALAHQDERFAAQLRQLNVPQRGSGAGERKQRAQFDAVERHLAAPWDELLRSFERHGAGDVALVRFEPDAGTGNLTVVARARHRRVMMAYVMALEADPRLAQVLLTSHELLPDVEGTPVQFSISARWWSGLGTAAGAQAKEATQ